MSKYDELENLRNRMKDIVINTCNTIGCKSCDLKWDDSCSALELQSKIMDIEFSTPPVFKKEEA